MRAGLVQLLCAAAGLGLGLVLPRIARSSGARSSLNDLLGRLPARAPSAGLSDGAGQDPLRPADRLWLWALSRLIPRRRWGEVFAVTRRRCSPGTGAWSGANGIIRTGGVPDGRPRQPRSASS